MAEVSQFKFDHKEVVEALIKKQGLHEGIWQLSIEFGFGAAIIGAPTPGAPAPDQSSSSITDFSTCCDCTSQQDCDSES